MIDFRPIPAVVRRIVAAVSIAAAASPIAALGAPVQEAEGLRPIALADYYALKNVGSPVISPDGNWGRVRGYRHHRGA